MRKLILLSSVLLLTACGEWDNFTNSIESSVGALSRDVTLYTNDGHVIKSWHTNNAIEYKGPIAGFIDDKGNNVRISGTFIVEGK
jgi:hypothetical protein